MSLSSRTKGQAPPLARPPRLDHRHDRFNRRATTYAYDPYGRPREWSGPRFRYTGQAALPELQLYHYKARVYDPGIGRFLQTDPIGYEDDLNLYAYVRSDPLNNIDPSGRQNEAIIDGLNDARACGAGCTRDRVSARTEAAAHMLPYAAAGSIALGACLSGGCVPVIVAGAGNALANVAGQAGKGDGSIDGGQVSRAAVVGVIAGPALSQAGNATNIVVMGTALSAGQGPYVSGQPSASTLPGADDLRSGLAGTLPGPSATQLFGGLGIELIASGVDQGAAISRESPTIKDTAPIRSPDEYVK